MKYDSYEEYSYFVLGASIAAGRVFWTKDGDTNKGPILITESTSRDGSVASVSFKVGEGSAV